MVWLAVLCGTVFGVVAGAMPGIGTTLAYGLVLPFTFVMSPVIGVAFLLAISVGVGYGNSIPAILMGIPGNPRRDPHGDRRLQVAQARRKRPRTGGLLRRGHRRTSPVDPDVRGAGRAADDAGLQLQLPRDLRPLLPRLRRPDQPCRRQSGKGSDGGSLRNLHRHGRARFHDAGHPLRFWLPRTALRLRGSCSGDRTSGGQRALPIGPPGFPVARPVGSYLEQPLPPLFPHPTCRCRRC